MIALQSLLKGVGKLQVNETAIRADIDEAWEVLAEAVQTVMRRYGIPNPYEQLKSLTRGRAVSKDVLHEFIATLDIPDDEKSRLLQLTPATYLGLAEQLAREV
jgi:adenylosuccinate lyase